MRHQFLTLVTLLTVLFVNSQNKELDSLTLHLAFQNPDSSKVDTSLEIIEILYNNQDYKRAIQFIDESERLAKNLNYLKGMANASYYKALIFANKDDYYNAIDYFLKSKDIYQKINDRLGVAKVDNGIGLIEIKRGNYQKGLESSLKAISVFEEKNLNDNLSSAYNNLAVAYFNTSKLDKALEYNFKAAEVREKLNDTLGLMESYKNVASLYSLKNNPENSINYYNKVLELCEDDRSDNTKGEILPKIGIEYLNLKIYDKAADNLIAGLRYNRANNNKEGLLESLNGLAKYNLLNKRFKIAEAQAIEASQIVKELGTDQDKLENFELMMKLDSAKGDFRNAFIWQRNYQNLKEKIYKKEYINAEISTTTDYDVVDEIKEKNQLEEALQKNKANIKFIDELKLIIYSLGGLLTLISIILIIVLFRRRKWIKYSKELEEQNNQLLQHHESILKQTKNLEEINVVKDKLFSIVSHDLKDSVTSIKAFIDLLKDGSLSKQEFDQLVPELSENADNASLLLLNLLNWSKSQMESLKPKPVFFDLQEVFRDKVKLIEQKMEKKKIHLIDETRSETVYADRSMIEIVIQNLLTNAVKFCREDDTVTITNSGVNGKVVFAVKDTGLGIPAENQEKLFTNSFTTIGTSNEKGTGLGLTICKELVELNHGKIWVESIENMGSKFYVELPRGPVSRG